MFYLLFRYSLADTRKVYQEFKSKEDLIKFIEEKKKKIEIDKIIEAQKEFEISWIPRLDEIEKPRKMTTEPKKLQPQIEGKRKRGRPKKTGKLSPEYQELLNKTEAEGNGLEDEHKEETWQLEISIDSQGRKKRKCWYPNCRKWFVIKYKGQHYCREICRQKHKK